MDISSPDDARGQTMQEIRTLISFEGRDGIVFSGTEKDYGDYVSGERDHSGHGRKVLDVSDGMLWALLVKA